MILELSLNLNLLQEIKLFLVKNLHILAKVSFSKFLSIERRVVIGLQLEAISGSPDLKMGITIPYFKKSAIDFKASIEISCILQGLDLVFSMII